MQEAVNEFFSLADFAEIVRIQPVTGVRYTASAIVTEPARVQDVGELGVQATYPEAIVATSSLRAAATGDLLTADRGIFEVLDVLPDGTGITRLRLRRR